MVSRKSYLGRALIFLVVGHSCFCDGVPQILFFSPSARPSPASRRVAGELPGGGGWARNPLCLAIRGIIPSPLAAILLFLSGPGVSPGCP